MPTTVYFETREESRLYCAEHGIPQRNVQKNRLSIRKATRWLLVLSA